MYQQRPQGMQPQRPGQIPPTLQQQQQMQQQRMGRPGMPQGNYPNQQQQSQMGMHQGGQPQQQQAQQSRGQPSQQQQQQAAAPPQVSPKIPQEKKCRACATNEKIEKSKFASKEAEYETKYANRLVLNHICCSKKRNHIFS